jgi:hypothetical protein
VIVATALFFCLVSTVSVVMYFKSKSFDPFLYMLVVLQLEKPHGMALRTGVCSAFT